MLTPTPSCLPHRPPRREVHSYSRLRSPDQRRCGAAPRRAPRQSAHGAPAWQHLSGARSPLTPLNAILFPRHHTRWNRSVRCPIPVSARPHPGTTPHDPLSSSPQRALRPRSSAPRPVSLRASIACAPRHSDPGCFASSPVNHARPLTSPVPSAASADDHGALRIRISRIDRPTTIPIARAPSRGSVQSGFRDVARWASASTFESRDLTEPSGLSRGGEASRHGRMAELGNSLSQRFGSRQPPHYSKSRTIAFSGL